MASRSKQCTLMTFVILAFAASSASATPSVTSTGTSGATDLDLGGLGTPGTYIAKVADVTLSTDAAGGFNATVIADALGKAGGAPIAIQVVLVADGAGTPGASAFTSAAGAAFTLATGSAGTVEKDLYIRYAAATFQDPGLYSAVVHVEVLDN